MSKRRTADKEKARALRAEGKSYSEIKNVLKVSKSSLSLWLRDMPLTPEQMRKVRDFNPRKIERYRATMESKREKRLSQAYTKVCSDVGQMSDRELFIAGLFLYWGEGAKTMRGTLMVSNTDPEVLRFFLRWLEALGAARSKVRVKLHLYVDMDVQKETAFWSDILSISVSQFRNPYIKSSTLSGITYKTGYGHGTCNVFLGDIALWEYIMMALKYIKERRGV
jgi:hypothetical protein